MVDEKKFAEIKQKKYEDLTNEEVQIIANIAAEQAIAKTHAAGRPSTHGDDKGVYQLYPDGRKEYIKLYANDSE